MYKTYVEYVHCVIILIIIIYNSHPCKLQDVKMGKRLNLFISSYIVLFVACGHPWDFFSGGGVGGLHVDCIVLTFEYV